MKTTFTVPKEAPTQPVYLGSLNFLANRPTPCDFHTNMIRSFLTLGEGIETAVGEQFPKYGMALTKHKHRTDPYDYSIDNWNNALLECRKIGENERGYNTYYVMNLGPTNAVTTRNTDKWDFKFETLLDGKGYYLGVLPVWDTFHFYLIPVRVAIAFAERFYRSRYTKLNMRNFCRYYNLPWPAELE